jgi:hypothetical protein
MFGRKSLIGALLCTAVVAHPAMAVSTPAEGKQLYVSIEGSDKALGTSTTPLRTVNKALAVLGDGTGTIWLGPGSHEAVKDTQARGASVLIRARRGADARLKGIILDGARRVSFADVAAGDVVMRGVHDISFEAVAVRGLISVGQGRGTGSTSVTFRGGSVSSPGELCFVVRGGSREVLIEDSHIFDCRVGIGGVATDPRSSDVVIRGNLLERFTGDGIQFGGWNDVRIDGNVIRKMADPLGETHNDGIQLTGNTRNVAITNNSITESNGQLLFIRDNFGPNDDLLVQNNLIARAGAYAVQNMGATRARYINNTIWYSRYGGLLLRRGGAKGAIAPRDTVVVNNILSGYAEVENATAATYGANAVGKCTKVMRPGTTCVKDPLFTNVAAGDFRVSPASPVLGLGATHNLQR